MINIEVAYATGKFVELIPLAVKEGTTVMEAIHLSGMLHLHPSLQCGDGNIGIYSSLCREDTVVKEGDRIEIYRPLIADPKQARRMRASRQKSQRQ